MICASKAAGASVAFPLPDATHGKDSATDRSEIVATSTSRGVADMGAVVAHWLLGLLLVAGHVLRAVAQVGYEPALRPVPAARAGELATAGSEQVS